MSEEWSEGWKTLAIEFDGYLKEIANTLGLIAYIDDGISCVQHEKLPHLVKLLHEYVMQDLRDE